jgi:hypothetical protein
MLERMGYETWIDYITFWKSKIKHVNLLLDADICLVTV